MRAAEKTAYRDARTSGPANSQFEIRNPKLQLCLFPNMTSKRLRSSRIWRFTDDECRTFAPQIAEIVAYVEKLNETTRAESSRRSAV